MEILVEPTLNKLMVVRPRLAGSLYRVVCFETLCDKVLKLKNFKKDATLKPFKSTNQERLLIFFKKDERGIVIKNKARIKAIRLFLAYASFKDFVVYQMDVKSDFLYGKIEEEIYVCQPPGFKDPNFPNRVYKVEKALYGLHQAPRPCKHTYGNLKGFAQGWEMVWWHVQDTKCKKQTVVTNSTTEAEYVVASSFYGQSDLVSKRIERIGELKNRKRDRVFGLKFELMLVMKVNAARHKLTTAVKVNAA
ncbi:putative ribonuclease H-like domain-containing protein [Tanacetum coccineum]